MYPLTDNNNSQARYKLREIRDALDFCDYKAKEIEATIWEIINSYLERRTKSNMKDIEGFEERKKGEMEIDYVKFIEAFEDELNNENQNYDMSSHPAYLIAIDSLFVAKSLIRMYDKILLNYQKIIWQGIYKNILDKETEEEEEKKPVEPIDIEKSWKKLKERVDPRITEMMMRHDNRVSYRNFMNLFTGLPLELNLRLKDYINARLGIELFAGPAMVKKTDEDDADEDITENAPHENN